MSLGEEFQNSVTTEAILQGTWRGTAVRKPSRWVRPTQSRSLARREHGAIVWEAIDQTGLKADGKDPTEGKRECKCPGQHRTPDRTPCWKGREGPALPTAAGNKFSPKGTSLPPKEPPNDSRLRGSRQRRRGYLAASIASEMQKARPPDGRARRLLMGKTYGE